MTQPDLTVRKDTCNYDHLEQPVVGNADSGYPASINRNSLWYKSTPISALEQNYQLHRFHRGSTHILQYRGGTSLSTATSSFPHSKRKKLPAIYKLSDTKEEAHHKADAPFMRSYSVKCPSTENRQSVIPPQHSDFVSRVQESTVVQLRHDFSPQPFNLRHIQRLPRPKSELTPNEATEGVTVQSHQRNSEGHLYTSNFNPMYFSFRGKGSDHYHPSLLKRANTVNYRNRQSVIPPQHSDFMSEEDEHHESTVVQLRHPHRLQPFNLRHIQNNPRPKSELTPNEATDGVTLQSHQRNSEGHLYPSNLNPMYFSFRGKGSDHYHPSSLKRANTVNDKSRAAFQLMCSQQPQTQCSQYDIVDVTQLYEKVTSQLNNTTQATLPIPQRFTAEVIQPNTRRSRSLWRSIICCCCRPSTLPEADPSKSNVHRAILAIPETPPQQQMTIHFNKDDLKLFADLRLSLNKSNKTDSDEDGTTLELTSDRVVKYIKASQDEKAEQICNLLITLKDLDTLPDLLYLNAQQTHDDIDHNRHWLELFLRLAGFSTKSYSQPLSIFPAFTRIQLSAALKVVLKNKVVGTQKEKYREFVNEFFEEQQIVQLLTNQQLHKKELDKKEVYDV